MAMTLPKLRKSVLDKMDQKFTDAEAHQLALFIFRINTQKNYFNYLKMYTYYGLLYIFMAVSICAVGVIGCLNPDKLQSQSLTQFLLINVTGTFILMSYGWYVLFIKGVDRSKSLSDVYETYLTCLKVLKYETQLLGVKFKILDILIYNKIGPFYDKKLGVNLVDKLIKSDLLSKELSTKLLPASKDQIIKYDYLLNLFDADDIEKICRYVPEKDLDKIYAPI